MAGIAKIVILVIAVSLGLFFYFADPDDEFDGPADIAEEIMPGGDEDEAADADAGDTPEAVDDESEDDDQPTDSESTIILPGEQPKG